MAPIADDLLTRALTGVRKRWCVGGGRPGCPEVGDFRANTPPVEFRGEVGDGAAIVAQVADVDVVARDDGEDVAVEFEGGTLLHEAEEGGAAAADEVSQIGQSGRRRNGFVSHFFAIGWSGDWRSGRGGRGRGGARGYSGARRSRRRCGAARRGIGLDLTLNPDATRRRGFEHGIATEARLEAALSEPASGPVAGAAVGGAWEAEPEGLPPPAAPLAEVPALIARSSSSASMTGASAAIRMTAISSRRSG